MAAYRQALDAALVGVSIENLTTWARDINNIGGTRARSMVDTATAGAIKMRLIFD
jgi:hypothetical protein